MTLQRYKKNLRKSPLLADFFRFGQIRLYSVLCDRLTLRTSEHTRGLRFFRYHSTITKEPSLCYDYNKRGTAEQVFDRQNNDFGWAHLPKSFMNQNTVFLLITAMAANFYRYIVALPLMAVLFGIKATDRLKSFLFRFIAVPAKWVRTARQYRLNIYSNKPYNIIWEHG